MDRYFHSEQMLDRALKTIPLGSQTFSKSITQYPRGVSPYFITKGIGSRVWDVDGNEYIDFINSLAAINLGYNDPDINEAVRNQLECGVSFSLSHPLEHMVSEKIVEMIPSAEMVRFGKNGSDATAGAVRLARAYTGRDRVAVCGYHGWQDWYIGTTPRNLGIPSEVRGLTHVFIYNDIETLHNLFKQYPDQIAAVILEPMNSTMPQEGFLAHVKDLAHKNGAILIFDETITGFRYSNGGAQEYFDVIPDLTTLGKGIANGFPLSAVAGRSDIMKLMEEIFFSFTFGGETLSLAAALSTMEKLQNKPVVKYLYTQGEKIIFGVRQLIEKYQISEFINISGHPSWSFLSFKDSKIYTLWQIKTLFLQEVFARGILTLGTHNLSLAHNNEDIAILLQVYDDVFALIKDVLDTQSLDQALKCEPLQPLFKVR